MKRNVKIENDTTIPKTRKKRKPMSEEQKAAAAERLAIAREKRLKENPPQYKSIMETYLRTGEWLDLFWGEYGQNKCKVVCLVMAYYANGKPKRQIGTWYPDIMDEWTKEMELEGYDDN